jgi:predicted membrane protein
MISQSKLSVAITCICLALKIIFINKCLKKIRKNKEKNKKKKKKKKKSKKKGKNKGKKNSYLGKLPPHPSHLTV